MRHPSSAFVQLSRARPQTPVSAARRLLQDRSRRPIAQEALEHFTQSAGSPLASGSSSQSGDAYKLQTGSQAASASLRNAEASLFNKDSPAFEPVILPPVPVKLRDSPFVQQFSDDKHGADDWDSEVKAGVSGDNGSNTMSDRRSAHRSLGAQSAARQRGRRPLPQHNIAPNNRSRLPHPTPPSAMHRDASYRPVRDRKSAIPREGCSETSELSVPSAKGSNRTASVGPSRRLHLANGASVDVYASMIVFQDPETKEQNVVSYPRLRELCQCDKCVDSSTKQRNFTLGQVMSEVKTSGWLETIPDSSKIYAHKDNLVIDWPSHSSRVTYRQLYRSSRPLSQTSYDLTKTWKRKFWVRPDMLDSMSEQPDAYEQSNIPRGLRVPYNSMFSEDGEVNKAAHTSLLTRLHRFGIAILQDVPTSQTDNQSCTLRRVAESIGPIRHTFYGETWNVKSMPQSKNVAYTDVNLGLHMDLLYFTEPPRFQLLHCLRNRVIGGDSYFVDSFGAALQFANIHPKEARLLWQTKLRYQYQNDGHRLENSHPIFPPSLDVQELRSVISWSPPFQGARIFPAVVGDLRDSRRFATEDIEFFNAIELWENFVEDPNRRYQFVMKEGDLVLFDNRRVLHARKSFRDMTEEERSERGVELIPGEPTRWLKGCYLDGDVVWDKISFARRFKSRSRSSKDGSETPEISEEED